MKHKLCSLGFLALALAAGCQPEPAATDDESGATAIDVEEALAALPEAKVLDRTADGVPRFVSGSLAALDTPAAPDDRTADRQLKAVLAAPLAAFRLQPDDLVLRRAHTDASGARHFRYRQVHDGLEVVNSDLVVHVDATGTITAINGTARGDLDPALGSRAITDARALEIATADRRLAGLMVLQHRRVYVQPADGGPIYLAEELTLASTDGADRFVRAFVDVDRAVVAEVHDQVAHARNRGVYDAQHTSSKYDLPGPLRRWETGPASSDAEVNRAFDNLGTTYDAYRAIFTRDSYNNSGGTINASVHYASGSAQCDARFTWQVSLIPLYWQRILVFGDGDGAGCKPLGRALDVVAHEYTHWVSYSEVGFNDSGEPNAINEGLSDIFGATVEAWAAAGRALPLRLQQKTWTLGEDALTNPFRKLCDPAWSGGADLWYAGLGSIDEHHGAGVADLAFCLLTRGGTHPRGLTQVNVTGIGMLDAAAIFYKAQIDYLVANSNYAQLRTATEQAAVALGFPAQVQRAVSCSWAAVGVGTVNGPCGTTDIIWRSTSTGNVAVWTMNGAGATGSVPGQAAGYQLVGTGDFSGDGKADILWRSESNGALAIWRMNGGTRLGDLYPTVTQPLAWQALAVGDFDGGGLSDILWRDPASGEVVIWFMHGATKIGQTQPTAAAPNLRMDATWQVAAIGDFNNDRVNDVLWRKDTGQMMAWLMNGSAVPSTSLGGVISTDWVIAGAGQFGWDPASDIVWRQTSTGQVAVWFVQGGNKVGEWYPGAAGAEWQIKGVGDFNGDAVSDILWRNLNGSNAIWLSGANTAAVYPSGAGTDWQIAATGQLD